MSTNNEVEGSLDDVNLKEANQNNSAILHTNPYQQAYVGPPNTQPGYSSPSYTAPNFASPSENPPAYSTYPSQPYPTQPYPTQPYPTNQPYPSQPYPQAYPPQPYPNQPYPAQPYPNQPYPPQPYPNQPYPATSSPPQADQPVIIVHTNTVHSIDATQPLPCGGLGIAWILFIVGWFIGISWFIGSFFACMGDPRERRGGRANLIVLVIWVALFIILLARGG